MIEKLALAIATLFVIIEVDAHDAASSAVRWLLELLEDADRS